MNKYIFYPGCSMEDNARSYYTSLMAIKDGIDIELQEIEDWNCCGATEYFSVNQLPAYALVSRNLALAQEQAKGLNSIVAPCSACYLNLSKTEHYLSENKDLNQTINQALHAGGMKYNPGSMKVQHLLDVINNDVGLEKVKQQVTKPLKGLRIAPYYGCLILRPDVNDRWSTPESHTALEDLLEALGATVVDYPMKAECCSGHMPQIDRDTAYELIRHLVGGAENQDADVIATLCPMCQLNLDMYQKEVNRYFGTKFKIPVLYITQLMGLAFGLAPDDLGIGSEFVSARDALAKIGTELPDDEVKLKRKTTKNEGLPMPVMPNEKKER
ncbi:MAG: CoB--CoM heterodisulfide reductase iron-sulfur subunit B family protein [Anaerolineales bacterium]|jgi:heterodisulfide reductase subunit B